MPTHDIIDNRNEKLADHINLILSSTEQAKQVSSIPWIPARGHDLDTPSLAGQKPPPLLGFRGPCFLGRFPRGPLPVEKTQDDQDQKDGGGVSVV